MTEDPGETHERADATTGAPEANHRPDDPRPDDPSTQDRLDVHHPPRRPPSRRALTLIVVPLIALVIAAYIGDALGPGLTPDPETGEGGMPYLLIMLNSRARWLVAVVNYVDPVLFFVIGTLRAMVSDPLFYLLGYWYGASAVRWMERRTPTFGTIIRTLERAFGRWGYPLVFIAPNNVVCLLAGSAGMRPALFLALNISGTITRLALIMILGEAFQAPIDWVLGFISDYRIPLLVVSFLAVGLTVWIEARKGSSEIDSLRKLEREIEGEDRLEDDDRA